jgi:hypothetical protein
MTSESRPYVVAYHNNNSSTDSIIIKDSCKLQIQFDIRRDKMISSKITIISEKSPLKRDLTSAPFEELILRGKKRVV